MASVTGRIKQIRQPRGGYLPTKFFKKEEYYSDNNLYDNENIDPSIVGMAVDVITRFYFEEDLYNVFSVSLKGAKILDVMTRKLIRRNRNYNKAKKLIEGIDGINSQSVKNACKLVGFDCVYRAGVRYYKDIDEIDPNNDTIDNIIEMVRRSVHFIESKGKYFGSGYNFDGGYSSQIHIGDCDFIVGDMILDLKVLRSIFSNNHKLQILVYYLLGKRTKKKIFNDIKRIALFNPRKNLAYIAQVENIPQELIKEVQENVIE